MRKTDTPVKKGFTLQTLRAIELFLDAVDKYDKDAKIFVSTENKGDINLNVNNQVHIGESKNYQNTHSITSKEILNTLVNFLDVWILSEGKNVTFGFYSTAGKKVDNYKLDNPILDLLENATFTDQVIDIVKSIVIKEYKLIYKQRKSNIDVIEQLANADWKTFLSKIDWKFNLEGNEELSDKLRKRIKQSKFLKDNEDYNGIESSILGVFTEQLDKKQESKNIFEKCFSYSDFEHIVTKEMFNRISKTDLSEFKELTKEEKLNEIKIPYDNFFFTKKEKGIIRHICNSFKYSQNKRFAILNGNRAQGKTILATQIGLEMVKENYKVLFYEMDISSTSDILLTLKAVQRKHTNVFCIITKCHLNINLFKRIIIENTEYPNIKFLFECRELHKEHFQEDLDFIDDIEISTLSFTLDEYQEKYFGIINKFFPGVSLNYQFINSLIKETGRNFVYLFEFLENQIDKDFHVFSKIETSKIRQKVKNEFFKKFEKNERLIEYAVINQYEIYINCSNEEKEVWFKELLNKDSVLINKKTESDFYSFYHSDFAKLIIKTYYETKNLSTDQQDSFEKTIFLKYFSLFDLNEIRVDRIFKLLYANSAKNLLRLLFFDDSFKNKLFVYYNAFDNFSSEVYPSKPLRELLMYVNELCPSLAEEYLNVLVLKNDNFGEILKGDDSFILTLIKLSGYFKSYKSKGYVDFSKNLSTHLTNIPDNISFSAITYYLSASYRTDKILYNLLSQIFSNNYLVKSIEKEEFLTLTEGLGCLYQVYNSSNKFIESISIDAFNDKAVKTELKRFAKGLQNLDSLNRKSIAEEIFESYSIILFKEKLQNLDLKNALAIANILKEYGYEKVYKTFQSIKFTFNASFYSFNELTTLLIEAHKYLENPNLATSFINSIDFNLIKENILTEHVYYVAHYLHKLSLCKGYENKVNEIYKSIPINFFLEKSVGLDFFKICELLHWLNKLECPDNNKTKEIYKFLEMNKFQTDIESLEFSKIILSLKNLNSIDKTKTKEILTIYEQKIFEKLGNPNYNQIGISILQLSEVNSVSALNYLKLVLADDNFKEWLIAKPIYEFSRTLKEFFIIETKIKTTIENRIVSDYFCSIEDLTIIQSAQKKEIRFDLLCIALQEFNSVSKQNPKKIDDIISQIGLKCFMNKICENHDFLLLAQGFRNLTEVNSDFTSNLFRESFVNLVNEASSSSIENFSLGLNMFAKVDKDKATLIFKNSELNLKNIAETTRNCDLDSIKKYISYLKPHCPVKTRELVQMLNTENLVFKFDKERNFDKATEYLSQLFEINNNKINEVVVAIGADKIYQRIKELDIKLILQGLSKLNKINEVLTQTVIHKITVTRELKKEFVSISGFADLTQKLFILKKITSNRDLLDVILHFIGVTKFVSIIEKSGKNQFKLGFSNLSQTDLDFTKLVAKELCKTYPKYVTLFKINREFDKLFK